MSFLKLTYCHLIKIILSQIGGNPLQQIYTQLSNGVPTIAPRSGLIPQGLSQVKGLIENVTSVINTAQQAVGDFSDTIERIGAQFYQNPIGTVLDGATAAANTRLAAVNAQLAQPGMSGNVQLLAEKGALSNVMASMSTYKTNTDRLSGVGTLSGSAAAGGCSLQDLLGSGCVPNQDVPDVDLQQLISSLKQGDAINAIKEKISSASGFSDYQQALAGFQNQVNGFNVNFNNLINTAAIRNAVTSQVTQIVYNLLSGCGNQVLDLTLKPNVKTAIEPYVTTLQEPGYFDSLGNRVTVTDTSTAALSSDNVNVALVSGRASPATVTSVGGSTTSSAPGAPKVNNYSPSPQSTSPSSASSASQDALNGLNQIEREINDLIATRENEIISFNNTIRGIRSDTKSTAEAKADKAIRYREAFQTVLQEQATQLQQIGLRLLDLKNTTEYKTNSRGFNLVSKAASLQSETTKFYKDQTEKITKIKATGLV